MKTSQVAKWAVALVVLVVAVVLVASWAGRQSSPAATPTPSSTASATTKASGTTTPPATTSAPASEDPSQAALRKRILDYEVAYRQLDPAKRMQMLEPYATPAYMKLLFPDGVVDSDYLKKLRENTTITLNLDSAILSAEFRGPTQMDVFTQIVQTKVSDGESTQEVLNHTTYWVRDVSGTWLVQSEAIN